MKSLSRAHPPDGEMRSLMLLLLAFVMAVDAAPILERSLLAARACSLAFVPPAAMKNEPYTAAANVECIAQVEDPESLAGATVFRRTDCKDGLIVACRGSASLKNFGTNLDIGPVPLIANPEAKVHAGFQKAGLALWKLIEAELPPSEEPILVCGHSLGGGTATMITLHLHEAGRAAELITVAGPKLGDRRFAEHFRERCGPERALHLFHDADDVLKSNVKLWSDLGFENVGTAIRCSSEEPCVYDDEDAEACLAPGPGAPTTPSLRGVFIDHCKYLGCYIGVRLEHPSVYLRAPW